MTAKLLTFAEAAALLRKTVPQARWMREHGDFPRTAKIGGRLMVRESDVDEYLAQKFADDGGDPEVHA